MPATKRDFDAIAFGERLRTTRERRGWKGNELARQSGVDATQISRLENAKRKAPTAEDVALLAKALRVRFDWLFYGEEPIEDLVRPVATTSSEGLADDHVDSLDRVIEKGRWWTPEMTPQQMSQVIEAAQSARTLARHELPEQYWFDYLQSLSRRLMKGEWPPPTVVDDDDELGGGLASAPKLPPKTRRR